MREPPAHGRKLAALKETARARAGINRRVAESGQCEGIQRDIKAMNDSSKVDLTDEINLSYDVSDEALESAAGAVKEKAGAFTLSFCSGLDTCPA